LVCSVVLSHYTSQKFRATDELGKDMHRAHGKRRLTSSPAKR